MWGSFFALVMGRGTWSWIVPDGLWEIVRPAAPGPLSDADGLPLRIGLSAANTHDARR